MEATISFLFDSTHPALSDSDMNACTLTTIKSILDVGAPSLQVRVKSGFVLLLSCVEHISSVEVEKVTSERGVHRETRIGRDVNRARLNGIVWDFLDNAEAHWHTGDLETLIQPLADHDLFSVTLINLPVALAVAVDEALRAAPGYLGALQVDLGNPVQLMLFHRFLVDQAVIRNRFAWIRSEDSEEMIAPPWCSKVGWEIVEVVPDFELAALAPIAQVPDELSANGQRTAQLLTDPWGTTSSAQLLHEIVLMADVTEESEYHGLRLSPSADLSLHDAQVPERKLTEYALSFMHPKGKHKAHLFKELLGIEAKDWRYLAAQLLRGLAGAKIERVRLSNHGVKYSAHIPVVGLNGVTKVVETGWIALNDQPPRLTTVLIADRDAVARSEAQKPPVIVQADSSEEKAREIYYMALREAEAKASATVPTPVKFADGPILREGKVGFAGVRIDDGRLWFAQWLRKHDIGWKHYKKGWYVPAKSGSQSVEVNRAYAAAFAEVLRLNGISCDVEWRLD